MLASLGTYKTLSQKKLKTGGQEEEKGKIPALGRQRQGDQEFKVSLGSVTSCFREKGWRGREIKERKKGRERIYEYKVPFKGMALGDPRSFLMWDVLLCAAK